MIITVLVWSERLLALAIFFQTYELLQLKATWSNQGVWRWATLRKGYANLPIRLLKILDVLLNEQSFNWILILRLLCSLGIWLFPSSLFMGVLFLSTWLIAIRWRGIFNGGSDSITALIALSLWLAQVFSNYSIIVKTCLAYIAIHVTCSYFLAGVAKLRNPEWLKGEAMSRFFKCPRYDSPPAWAKKLMEQPASAKLVSYAIIIFECAFPLAWVGPGWCAIFLALGVVFHLVNFWVFGLNRFFFAWLAGYPALIFWSYR